MTFVVGVFVVVVVAVLFCFIVRKNSVGTCRAATSVPSEEMASYMQSSKERFSNGYDAQRNMIRITDCHYIA